MVNDSTANPQLLPPVVLNNIFATTLTFFVVLGNLSTLIVVSKTKMFRQKKQIVSVLSADLFAGIVGLPLSTMHYNRIEVFLYSRICSVSMGIADFVTLNLVLAVSVTIILAYLHLKFPFKSESFRRWETETVITQWSFSVGYMLILTAVYVLNITDNMLESCDLSVIPSWYSVAFIAVGSPVLLVGFVSAAGILCIARKQAAVIESVEFSVSREQSRRKEAIHRKHVRLVQVMVVSFLLTWLPFTLQSMFSVLELDFGTDISFTTYIIALGGGASLSVIYSYAFVDVRSQFKFMVKRF